MKRTKKLTVCAVLCALAIVFLYLASFLPTLSLSLIAVAGFLPAIAIIECDFKYACVMTVASIILAFVLVPAYDCSIIYAILFAPYPFVKLFCEKIRFRALKWIAKLLCVNLMLFVLYICAGALIIGFQATLATLIFAWVAFNVIFVLYDLCFTKICALYFTRIHRHIV